MLSLLAVCVTPFAVGRRTTDSSRPGGDEVLWNQYGNAATEPPIGIGSQDFESTFDALDDQAADSNQFRDILVDAGLVELRGHEATKQGRSVARETSEISFHSLRHSAVTMLKAAGVSDFIAREIVGHESSAVSRQYTHLTTDDKRAAMRRLPDVTNG